MTNALLLTITLASPSAPMPGTPSPKDMAAIYANVLTAYQAYRGIGVTQRQAVDTWVSIRVGFQPEPFYCVKDERGVEGCRGWSSLVPGRDMWIMIVTNDHPCLLETDLPRQMLVVIHSEFGRHVAQQVPAALAKAVLPVARMGAISEGLCFEQR